MHEPRSEADLSIETLRAGKGAKLESQNFERDVAVACQIAREVDDRHSANTELAFDAISIGQRSPQVGDVIQGSLRAHAMRLAQPEADRKNVALVRLAPRPD